MITLHINHAQWIELGQRVQAAGKNAPKALTRAINHTGKKARTQMVRALADQTGLKKKTTRKALKTKQAVGPGDAFTIKAAGGNIRLKFFKARETRKGIVAYPWKKRTLYPGAFLKGGRFPKRVDLKIHGTALKRAGGSRYPLTTQRSGLFIAREMVSGQCEQAFYGTANRELPPRLLHELNRVLKGR